MDGSRYTIDKQPWRPPVPVEFFENVGKNIFIIEMSPSQRQRWERLTRQLKISMPATLDWCIRCWSEVQTQRLLDRTIICIQPDGKRITADFGIFGTH